MQTRHQHINYMPEVDGLRAIAVLAVVLHHALPRGISGGFVGVDVFFVISGYLITRILSEELRRTHKVDVSAFYAKRMRRLLPGLLVVVLATMVAGVFLVGRLGAPFDALGDSAIASLLFAANLWFASQSGGYFDDPAGSMPLLHLWSLGVEEQFYFIYPFVLVALWRLDARRLSRRLCILALASLLLAEYWVHILPERAFYQMPARFWELAAGGLVALSPMRPRRWVTPAAMVAAGLLMIAASLVATPAWGSFPGLGALPAVAGSAILIMGLHQGGSRNWMAQVLRSAPLVLVGRVSYPLYLWHWPLLVFLDITRINPAPWTWRLLACVAAFVLAWLTWRFIERPFREGRFDVRRTLWAGVLATAVSTLLVFGLARIDLVPAGARALARASFDDRPKDLACHFPSDEPIGLVSPGDCSSVPHARPRIVVWGDSHAMAWRPFAWRLASSRGVPAAGLTMNSCIPSARREDAGEMPRRAPCADMNEMALDWFGAGTVDTAIVAFRWPLGDPNRDLYQRIGALDSALGRMQSVRTVLVMAPTPFLRRPASECIQRGWIAECEISRNEFDESARTARKLLLDVAARYGNVRVVDASGFLCTSDACPMMRGGKSQFWDDDHLSASAVEAFAEAYLANPGSYTLPPDHQPLGRPEQ